MSKQPVYLPERTEQLFLYLSFGVISLIGFEALAVATAMPTVVEELNGLSMYALAMGVPLAAQMMTVALAGPWSDSIGPRSCLFTGITLFSIGLLVAAFAPSMPLFVLGRAVQGLGGGLSVVPLYTIIGASVKPSRQPRFFTAFAAAWILPGLIGPAIAGFVVVHFSWRWVFGAVPVIMLISAFPIAKITGQVSATPKPFDRAALKATLAPAIVAGIAIAVLQVSSGQSPEAFNAATYATILASGLIAIAAVRPLFPAGTFASRRGLGSTVLLRGTINGTFIGTETYLPLMLKQVHGWTPFQAGLVLTISSVMWALGSWYQGRIIDRAARMRLPLAGALAQTVGIAITIPAALAAMPGWLVLIGWVIAGLGCGLAYPGMSVHALALTPLELKGRTSSALQMADTFAGAFAIAITGVVFTLLHPHPALPFIGAIGLMVLMQLGAVASATRIMPPPGSPEAIQLETTYSLEDESTQS